MDVAVCDLGSRYIRAGKADPFPNDKEPWVVRRRQHRLPDSPAAALLSTPAR